MTKYMRSLLAATTVLCGAGTASAQIPNYGNYEALKGTLRVGVSVTNQFNQFNDQDSFDQTALDGIIDYIDPSELTGRICAFNTATAAIDAVFDAAVEDDNSPTSRALLSCLAGALVRSSPLDPPAGNPSSLQSSLARNALDFTSGDLAIEEQWAQGADAAGDPWIVGTSYGLGNAGRFDLTRIDARIARGFRVFEDGRSRLKVDMPFSYTRINGAAVYTGQVVLGLDPGLKNGVFRGGAAYETPITLRAGGRSLSLRGQLQLHAVHGRRFVRQQLPRIHPVRGPSHP